MYDQYNAILATDFNSLIGTVNGSAADKVNSFWGVGFGNAGYGQPQINEIDAGGRINATSWAAMFNAITNTYSHTNLTLSPAYSAVDTGSRINYLSQLTSNISSAYAARNNALSQGTTSTTAGQRTTSWSNAVSIVHTITFESGDKARYFFNAGGQIAIQPVLTGGTTSIYTLFQNLAVACGTIYLSSPVSTNTVTISGTSYRGITKVGGSGSATIAPTLGYYGLGTTDSQVFKQLATGLTPSGYVNSFISVNMRTNGPQGSNGDNGSVITVTTTFDEVPNNLVVNATATTVNCTIRPPSSANLTNTWGTVTVTATQSGT